MDGSSDERASNTSESDSDIVHMHDGGSCRELMLGREKELPVKAEWKNELKSSALSVSEVALELFENTEEGMELFFLSDRM